MQSVQPDPVICVDHRNCNFDRGATVSGTRMVGKLFGRDGWDKANLCKNEHQERAEWRISTCSLSTLLIAVEMGNVS